MPRLSWRFLLVLLALTFVTEATAQQAVRWQSDLEAAKREALQTNRLILVHYWATWCPACYRMENEVFAHPSVAAAVHEKFVPVKLNFDHYQVDARAMGVTILPTDIVMSADGQVVKKLPGFARPSEYMALLADVGGNSPVPPQHGYQGATAVQPVGIANQAVAVAQPAPTVQAPTSQMPTSQMPPADYLGERYANYRGENLSLVQSVPPATQYAARQPVVQSPISQPPIAQPPIAQSSIVQTPIAQPPFNPVANGGQLPAQYSSTPLQASQAQTASQHPQPAQQPISPPIAEAATGPAPPTFGLDGFCPVSLVDDKAWKFGDRRWGATHLGVTYLFTSLENQQKFLKTPDRYSPVGLGNDIVVLLESGKTIPGQRKHGVSFAGRIYLFASQQSLDAFTKQPRHYIENFSRMIQASRQQYGQNVR